LEQPIFRSLSGGRTTASFQIFLPSLPAIRDGFGVPEAVAQLALSLSMLGIAAATLIYGRLADRWGRRPVLIGGMGVLLAGSLVCAASPSIGWLIAGRILQAAGGASGMVVTRAIVLDLYGREQAGRTMAGLLAAMMIAPMLSTPLGGALTDLLGWRANFVAISTAALGTLALVMLLLPETRRVERTRPSAGLLTDYRRLLASRSFDGFALQGGFAMGAFLAFTTAAPYALSGELGLSATQVGAAFVVVSVGFAAGSLLATRLPPSIPLTRRAVVGSAAGLVAVGVGLALAVQGAWTLPALIGPATAYAFATGVTMPASQAGAIGAVPELSGTASGFSGFLGTLIGAGSTQIVGSLSNGTPVPVMVGMGVLALASLGVTLVAFRSGSE
jgi:DHA1 family bicyclomycin/chloramphenicol resistance-like MFS transporter